MDSPELDTKSDQAGVVRASGTNVVVAVRGRRWSHYLAAAVAIVIFCSAIAVLHRELSAIRLADVTAQLRGVPLSHLLLAMALCVLSHLALTNYDRLALAYLNATRPLLQVMVVSFTAVAIGHNVGVAALSGGSIRYRAYAKMGFSALDIAKIIAFCSATFALGSSVLLGFALIFEPASMLAHLSIPTIVLKCAGVILLLLPIAYAGGSFIGGRTLRFRGWTLAWPATSVCLQQLVFACLDLSLAAGVLYVMLPATLGVSYATLLGAYLIALGLAVVSNVPGGLGVIEGMLLLLLPELPHATLLGAVLGYRIIYYIIPLIVALIILVTQEVKLPRRRTI